MSSQQMNKTLYTLEAAGEEESMQQEISRKKRDLLDRIKCYVNRDLQRKITLQDISKEFGVSVSTVTQLFQHCCNTTFHQYLTESRMRAAEELIQSGVPLEEAGRMVGYGDHSTFYRAFRQTFGVSPREYRRKQMQDFSVQ